MLIITLIIRIIIIILYLLPHWYPFRSLVSSLIVLVYNCSGVVRDDLDTGLYLLPHLVVNVLTTGTPEDRQSIKEEVLIVLNTASSPTKSENTEINEMGTQRVFYLIDWLYKWVEAQKKSTRSSSNKRSKGKTPDVSNYHDTQLYYLIYLSIHPIYQSNFIHPGKREWKFIIILFSSQGSWVRRKIVIRNTPRYPCKGIVSMRCLCQSPPSFWISPAGGNRKEVWEMRWYHIWHQKEIYLSLINHWF